MFRRSRTRPRRSWPVHTGRRARPRIHARFRRHYLPRRWPIATRPRALRNIRKEWKEREAQLCAKSSRVSLEGFLRSRFVRPASKTCHSSSRATSLALSKYLPIRLSECPPDKVRVKSASLRCRLYHRERRAARSAASNAIIIGFNVRPERKCRRARSTGSCRDSSSHSIIYELQDEMRLAMMGLLEPTFKENSISAAPKSLTPSSGFQSVGTIAGCRVQDRRHPSRRGNQSDALGASEQVHKGKIGSARSASRTTLAKSPTASECGIGIANYRRPERRRHSREPSPPRRWPPTWANLHLGQSIARTPE